MEGNLKFAVDASEFAKQGGKIVVDQTKEVLKDVSTGANYCAAGGVVLMVAGGLSGNPALVALGAYVTDLSLNVGTAADVVGMAAETADYAMYDGTLEDLEKQGIQTGFSITTGLLKETLQFTRLTGNAAGAIFHEGRYVTNVAGTTSFAVQDAVRISFQSIMPESVSKLILGQ